MLETTIRAAGFSLRGFAPLDGLRPAFGPVFEKMNRLVRESLLAPTFAGIPSDGPPEPIDRREAILLKRGTR